MIFVILQTQGKGFLFLDENVPTFFRRLSWSPDGNLLICPTGVVELREDGLPTRNATHIFTRTSFPHPVVHLPTTQYPSVAVRFSNVLYELKPNSSNLFDLNYRMVYAVATTDSTILIYDTQHVSPIALISGVHYEPITDLTWSNDGNTLVMSSADGYITCACFDNTALGVPLSYELTQQAYSVIDRFVPTPSTPKVAEALPLPPVEHTKSEVVEESTKTTTTNTSITRLGSSGTLNLLAKSPSLLSQKRVANSTVSSIRPMRFKKTKLSDIGLKTTPSEPIKSTAE